LRCCSRIRLMRRRGYWYVPYAPSPQTKSRPVRGGSVVVLLDRPEPEVRAVALAGAEVRALGCELVKRVEEPLQVPHGVLGEEVVLSAFHAPLDFSEHLMRVAKDRKSV